MTHDPARPGDLTRSTDDTLGALAPLPARAAAGPGFAALRARLAADLFGVSVEAPRIGRFRIEDQIGAGAMGSVFAAYDEHLARRVAIKILHPETAETPEGRLALVREAQALARLAHPNVVSIFEVGEHGDGIFLAMELVAGQSLDAWLTAADAPRPWRAILEVYLAAGRGLAAAHAAGLVHRDFKPSNVLVGDDGRVRVVDFGLARAQREAPPAGPTGTARIGARALTTTATIAGTPAYMAPEVLAGERADASADLYAFSVALHEGLHGVRPHVGDNIFALALAKASGPIATSPTGAGVPRWLTEVIARGLAPDRARRWPSMDALLHELARDRGAARRRAAQIAALVVATTALGGLAAATLDTRAEVERADAEANAARERLAAAAIAEESAEVRRLAGTAGRERDALALGVRVLAPFAPTFVDAPPTALEGIVDALPAMLHRSALEGHTDIVHGLALAAAGHLLASLDAGGEVQLWDPANATRGPRLQPGPADPLPTGLALNPTGTRLLTIAAGRCVHWDTTSGARLGAIPCPGGPIHYDGERVYSGQAGEGASAGLIAWDANTGDEVWRVPEERSDALALALARSPGQIFVGHGDGAVDLRGSANGSLLAHLPAPTGAKARLGQFGVAPLLALSHAGDALLVGDHEGELRLWRPALDAVRHLGPASSCDRALFAADDASILVRCGQFQVLETATGERLGEAPPGEPLAVLGDALLVDRDGIVRVEAWRGTVTARLPPAAAFAASSDGRLLATATGTRIDLWTTGDPRSLDRWSLPADESVVPCSDPSLVASVTTGGVVHLREFGAERAPRVLYPPPTGEVRLVVPFAAGAWIMATTSSGDTHLSLHDRATGSSHSYTPSPDPDAGDLVFALQAPRLAALRGDGALEVIDAARGQRLCTHAVPDPTSARLAIGPDGARVAVAHADGRLEILDGSTCAVLTASSAAPENGAAAVDFLHYGADGSLVERRGRRTTIHGSAPGTAALRLDDPCPASAPAGRAVLSPDRARLVSTCGDAVYLWRTDTGERLATIDRPRAWTWMITPWNFSASGAHLLVIDGRGDARILDTRAGSEITRLRGWLGGSDLDTPWSQARLVDDGGQVEAIAPGGALVRYSATRAGTFDAACRALAATDAADEVAALCPAPAPALLRDRGEPSHGSIAPTRRSTARGSRVPRP
jgi:WD40 repeat protein